MSAAGARPCPPFEEISSVFSAAAAGSVPGPVAEHLAQCARCAAIWKDLEDMKRAGQALEWSAPSPARAAELEARLVLSARSARFDRGSADVLSSVIRSPARLAVAAGVAVALISIGWLLATSQQRSTGAGVSDIAKGVNSLPVAPEHAPARALARRGTVRPRGEGVKVEHFTRHPSTPGAPSDEIVRLTSGTVDLEVEPLERGERFRVVAGDGEVEVRGTSFSVRVEDDRLVEVEVRSGLVEVRPPKGAGLLLSKGERWSAAEPAGAAAAASSSDVPGALSARAPSEMPTPPTPPTRPMPPVVSKPTPPRQPMPSVAPEPTPPIPPVASNASGPEAPEQPAGEERADDKAPSPPTASRPAERAFAAGWTLLKEGDPTGAVARFDEAIAADPDDALAEDARYWRAIALAKAGRDDGAESALNAFLERHAGSPRAAEVHLLLGWRVLARGELDLAERMFRSAKEGANDDDVRARAERGLARVAALRRRY